MAKQLYFEDVDVGSEISPLIKHPTPRQLVMWAGASGDYNEIHYNKEAALKEGLPDIIVHGRLKSSFLCQMLTDWMGEEGFLKKIAIQHRGMDILGKSLTCKGRVLKKYVQEGKYYIECEIWAENSEGQKTVPGSAILTLPSRG